MSSVGGPDGKCAVHSLGSKGLAQRIQEERMTRKTPSVLNILLGLNKKKDKTTDKPIGEFNNPKLGKAYEEYRILYREQYGEDADPLQAP
ncbi:hypothetical protein LIER_17838 [Lithospermum erythrorhizon]|uniref:Uncharacterized protein n=1 Tax=Lithospermum erythrorhizon TaxID=34254 RepID=A0AAV3QBU2_LITER